MLLKPLSQRVGKTARISTASWLNLLALKALRRDSDQDTNSLPLKTAVNGADCPGAECCQEGPHDRGWSRQ